MSYFKSVGGEDAPLNQEDLEDLSSAAKRVGALMLDYEWHSASEILEVAGQREGIRRLRELRQRGYEVEKKRPNKHNREWYYRLKKLWEVEGEEQPVTKENGDANRTIRSIEESSSKEEEDPNQGDQG